MDINERIQEYQKRGVNLLLPVTTFTDLSDFHTVTFNEVRVNPDPGAGEIYPVALKKKKQGREWVTDDDRSKYALSGTTLQRLGVCAQFHWHPTACRRTDDRA